MKKYAENFAKQHFMKVEKERITAVEPNLYGERLYKFMRDHVLNLTLDQTEIQRVANIGMPQ